MTTVNLMPKQWLVIKHAQACQRHWQHGLVAGAVGLVAVLGGCWLIGQEGLKSGANETQVLMAQQAHLEKQHAKLLQQKQTLEQNGQTGLIVRSRVNWARLFDVLGQSQTPALTLDRVALVNLDAEKTIPVRFEIPIDGQAPDQQAISKFALALEQTQLFESVHITRMQREKTAFQTPDNTQTQGMVRFQLVLAVNHHPAPQTGSQSGRMLP